MPAYRFRGSPHGSRQIRRGCFVNTEEINPHLTAKIRGELRQAPEIGAGSTFRSDYLRSSDDRSAWTAESTGGGSGPCGVGARRSVHRDYVVCLDCGYRGKTLRRHISTRHGLSPDEYRRRWGLRSNHPLRLSFILSIV